MQVLMKIVISIKISNLLVLLIAFFFLTLFVLTYFKCLFFVWLVVGFLLFVNAFLFGFFVFLDLHLSFIIYF